MHPLPAFGISCHRGVDGIHFRVFGSLYHFSRLSPRALRRRGCGHSDVGCILSESRHAIIKPVGAVAAVHNIWRPNVCCPFAVGICVNPLHCLCRNLREHPPEKLPIHEVFRAAHLNEPERHIFLGRLFTVFAIYSIGGIHIIIVAYLSA